MLDDLFDPLDAEVYAHIRDLDTGATLGVRETEPVILVSVVKLFIAYEFARHVDEGLVDPATPVTITAADRLGGTGTAGFHHDAVIAVGDLAALMMEVSDNTSADLVAKHLGTGSLRDLPTRLGLTGTRLFGSPRVILEGVARDLDVHDLEALAPVLASGAISIGQLRGTSAWDPARTNASTPADLTAFLHHIWNGPAGVARDVRGWMRRQLTGRLARLAPSEVTVHGRSGTLPGWLNEAAVWEWPDGRRHAIAVSARTHGSNLREVELAMSRAALRLTDKLGSAR